MLVATKLGYSSNQTKAYVYAASSWKNNYQPEVVKTLRERNYDVYDFKNPAPDNNGFKWEEIDINYATWTPDQLVKALMDPIAVSGFKYDFDAMKKADACLLILPSGNSAHLEAGWLAGRGKPVFVYAPELKVPELMYKCFHDSSGNTRMYSKLDRVIAAMDQVFHTV